MYFFECVHLVFKVIFSGVLIFYNGNVNEQLTLAMLALLLYSFLSRDPYRDPCDNFMWNICLTCIFLSVYLSQLQVAQARVS